MTSFMIPILFLAVIAPVLTRPRRVRLLAAVICLLALAAGCAAPGDPAPEMPEAPTGPAVTEPVTQPVSRNRVGVSLPTGQISRWDRDGTCLKELLEARGCEVTLAFADSSVQTQVDQLRAMIREGCQVLVVAPIEGDSLGTVLAEAKKNGVTVIAYDRLIMNTADVDCYVTFDNSAVGQVQGQFIVDALDLDHAEGPFNIELVAGDPGDCNTSIFYDSVMSVLRPYMDAGKLVVVSDQTEFSQAATPDWKTEYAQARMENILSTYYPDRPLHAVWAANDSTAQGVANALASNYSHDIYPVITGQDCDIVSVKNMIAGKQAMSAFKDTRVLAAQAAGMAADLLEGRAPEINNTTYYDNGVKVVPAYLCTPVVVTAENYRERLLDSGYYTEEDLA